MLPASFRAPLRLYSTKREAQANTLPHLTTTSEIHLVSVCQKPVTHRVALAIGHVAFSNHQPLRRIRENMLKKGDVLAVARLAGIQAIKKTGEIVVLAHGGIGVEGGMVKAEVVNCVGKDTHVRAGRPAAGEVERDVEQRKAERAMQLELPIGQHGGVRIAVQVETTAKTGVEMEALTGVMGAALTVVDMVKGVDKGVVIEEVKVVGKKGGRSGGWGIWKEDGEKG
ncbi:MAG: hypothetical protein Q9217_001288 [Psora testacea]